MNKDQKKAAIAAYKERKTVAGIFAVRCQATGQVWVGGTPNLETARNGIWFSLSHGGGVYRALHGAWTAHGEDQFAFEELERFDDEDLPYVRRTQMKARAAYWRTKLGASAII